MKMFCDKCGTPNSHDSLYCKKCGRLLEAEAETRVAVRGNTEDRPEVAIFSVTPTLKFVYVGYFVAVIAAFLVVAIFSLFFAQWISAAVGVLIGVSLLLIPAFYHLKQKLVRYTLTGSKIEIDKGLISRTTLIVPLRRVQDVTVSASISQRLLGMGNIIIDNAGTDGERIVLSNIDSPRRYSDMLLKQIRKTERQDAI